MKFSLKPQINDNGPYPRARILDEITEYLGTKGWYTSAYMMSANGKIERKDKELAYMLGIHARQEPNNWCGHSSFVVFTINTAYSRLLHKTPLVLQHFRDPRICR